MVPTMPVVNTRAYKASDWKAQKISEGGTTAVALTLVLPLILKLLSFPLQCRIRSSMQLIRPPMVLHSGSRPSTQVIWSAMSRSSGSLTARS